MSDLLHVRTLDGRECEVTQSQWDLIYSGDGSRIIGADDAETGDAGTAGEAPEAAAPPAAAATDPGAEPSTADPAGGASAGSGKTRVR